MASVPELLRRELCAVETRVETLRQELEQLPQGYVSKKAIKGREYFYLQHREGQQIKSRLIRREALEGVLLSVRRRRQLKGELRELELRRKQLLRLLRLESSAPFLPLMREKNT